LRAATETGEVSGYEHTTSPLFRTLVSNAARSLMTENEENFLQTVARVCAKPGLYLGRNDDFYAVVNFLEGYIAGLMEGGKLEAAQYPFGKLLALMEHKHGFSNPGWGWWRHYLHDEQTHENAIRDFPQFLRECMIIPLGRVEELHANRPRSRTLQIHRTQHQ
jgi:hypothetical protein